MKLNRRTRWKLARQRLLDAGYLHDDLSPAWFGPAGAAARFGTFFGGVNSVCIHARSKQRYWERLYRYVKANPPLDTPTEKLEKR